MNTQKCKRFGCFGSLEQCIITGDFNCTECSYKEEFEYLFDDEDKIADLYGYEE
jgi:hypothetical protein